MLSRVKGAMHKFLTGAAHMVAPSEEVEQITQPAHELSVEDLIKYPPETKGIPVIALEKILASQYEILRLMHRDSGLQDPKEDGSARADTPKSKDLNFDTLYRQVVVNLIKYVHLLPASENHHHSDVGGLVRHSLEVALHSMRRAQQQVLPAIGHLDDEQARKPRWQYAAWICGLLHDGGKILYDMRIYDVDSGKDWNPYLSDLLTWANENKVKRYRVTWKPEHRHKKHENLTVQILEWVLTPQAKAYLMDNSDELPIAINHALSHFGSKDGYLQTCLREADSASTEKDIRTQWHEMIGKRRYPLESAIVTAMRRLRDNWNINQPKGHVWIIDDQVYLAWPRTIQLIVQRLQDDKVDVPVNPTKILEILEERNLVQRLDENANYSLFTANMKGVSGSEKVIRLSWPGLLFETMPVPRSVPGVLRLNNEGKTIEYKDDGTVIESDGAEKPTNGQQSKGASAPVQPQMESAQLPVSTEKEAETNVPEKQATKSSNSDTKSSKTNSKKAGVKGKKDKPPKKPAGNNGEKEQKENTPKGKKAKVENASDENNREKKFGFNKLKFVPPEEMVRTPQGSESSSVGGSNSKPQNSAVEIQHKGEDQETPPPFITEASSEFVPPPYEVTPAGTYDLVESVGDSEEMVTPDFLQYYEEGSEQYSNPNTENDTPPSYQPETLEATPTAVQATQAKLPKREKVQSADFEGSVIPNQRSSGHSFGIGKALKKRKAVAQISQQPKQPTGWLGKKKHGRTAADAFLIDLANAMANGELSIEPGGGVLLLDGKLHIDVKEALPKLNVEAGPISTKLKIEKYLDYDAFKPNLLVQRKSINKKTILVLILTAEVSTELKAELGISVESVDYTQKPSEIRKPLTKAKPEETQTPDTTKTTSEKPEPESDISEDSESATVSSKSDKTEFEQFLDFLSDKRVEGDVNFITSSKDQSAWAIRPNDAVKAIAKERLPAADNVSIKKAITGIGIGTESIGTGSGAKKYILISKELIG